MGDSDEPRALGPRFREAFWLASILHSGQARKGTDVPYVAHLMAVSAIVLENGGDEDAAIAALLHDAAEDQGGRETLDRIGRLFGPGVRSIVEACTDTVENPKPPWRERKERYVDHIAEAPDDALLVSLADKVHNARSLVESLKREGDEIWKRFKGGKSGTIWYYEALVTAFSNRRKHANLVSMLKSAVDELAMRCGS